MTCFKCAASPGTQKGDDGKMYCSYCIKFKKKVSDVS